jgi:hypothetical protein
MLACPMTPTASGTGAAAKPGQECTNFLLRFRSLFHDGRGYSFPCDARGLVEMDRLSDRARTNYLYARAVIGREVHVPEVMPCGPHPRATGATGKEKP